MMPAETSPKTGGDAAKQAASWLISLLLHGVLLSILALITCTVLQPPEPDRVLTLRPPEAGVGDSGGGGGGASPASEVRESQARQSVPVPSAPLPETLDASLRSLMPETTSDVTAGAGDPSRALLQSVLNDHTAEVAAGGRGGGGVGRGMGKGFGDYLSDLGGRGLDVVIVLDATDSMEPFIEEARQRLHAIMDVITGLVPGTRFGVVAYKDYGDEYGADAVRSLPLTNEAQPVRRFINDVVAGGGGDIPEPIHEALRRATDRNEMAWGTRRKKVIILVGDSPIHSTGRQAALDAARTFGRGGGTINVIDVGATGTGEAQRRTVQPDLQRIAEEGRGSAFLLRQDDAFWRHLITSVFDQRFAGDVDAIIDKYVRDE